MEYTRIENPDKVLVCNTCYKSEVEDIIEGRSRNFLKMYKKANYEIICEKCKEKEELNG